MTLTHNDLKLSYIKFLPEETEIIIKEFIPIRKLWFLNKTFYIKYHNYVKKWIMAKNLYDNYIREVLRNDNDFVFKYLLKENVTRWKILKKYKYSNKIYKNYCDFIDTYCVDNESTKCREMIKKHINILK
jgi:hypothetical protein